MGAPKYKWSLIRFGVILITAEVSRAKNRSKSTCTPAQENMRVH